MFVIDRGFRILLEKHCNWLSVLVWFQLDVNQSLPFVLLKLATGWPMPKVLPATGNGPARAEVGAPGERR